MTPTKKLIEVALPLPEINDASAYDKLPGIGPHPKGIHHWWARLPLPTARAMLFASVVDDPTAHPEKWPTLEAQNAERERLFQILRRMMSKKLHEAPDIYADARDEMLKHCEGQLPAVFDPFAGGGSIPLEANRLGFDAHAGDLNPVAVLLNKCNLEIAPRWRNCPPVNPVDRATIGGAEAWRGNDGLTADVKYYGDVIRTKAIAAIGALYPRVAIPKEIGGGTAEVVAWIWSRTVASPNPAAQGAHVPLASTFVLSSKANKEFISQVEIDKDHPNSWRFCVNSHRPTHDQIRTAKSGTKAGKGQAFICTLTKTPIQRSYVQAEGKAGKLTSQLQAIVAEGPRGRLYISSNPEHIRAANAASSKDVQQAREGFLAGPLPTRAEITGGVCTAYGLSTWGHLYSDRQIASLLTLGNLVRGIRDDLERDTLACQIEGGQSREYAQAIMTFLALAIDRCADFNNTLCRWSPSNQKVMNLFGKQALPMVFDYAEANILGESVGAWKTCVEYVADCIRTISTQTHGRDSAEQMDAASESNGIKNIIVSTDPPYYNNISYATLSDFFYVWLRRNIGDLYPGLFGTVLAPKLPELIAAANRFAGDPIKAKEHFEEGFKRSFTSLRNRMDHRFPLTVYYAFKQEDESVVGDGNDGDGTASVDLTTGWETLLEALVSSGFQITGTWPVRASQKWRMISMGTNALASYIVLVCRPRLADAEDATRREFVAILKSELPSALRHLQEGNIAPVDLAQAAIGPGMAVYTRYNKVLDAAGKPVSVREALALINSTLDEVLTEQEGDFDAESRWALAWFEQNGFADGEFGVATVLAQAKNIGMNGLVAAGIVAAGRGNVRLLKPQELPGDWDPATDLRLTAWQIVHHLIRVLASGGEAAAAQLVINLGANAEVARELAYRLYKLCERKKRSAEALAYNGLVQSWPEVIRLAQETGIHIAEQRGLFGDTRG